MTRDRAVVRITAALRAYVIDRNGRRIMRMESRDEQITLTEYWTLARRGGAWIVASTSSAVRTTTTSRAR